jgi:hypothetical protein
MGHATWQRDVTHELCIIDPDSSPHTPPTHQENKMKKAILLCGMLLAISATVASAAGLNLRWQNCGADGGTQNRTFACNANAGSNVMVGSFVLDTDLLQVNGNELVVDLATAGPALADWWRFTSAGACRQTALAIAAHDGASCPDMFAGQASMNIAAYQLGLHGANSGRILCVDAVQAAAIVDLFAGQEYGIAKWTVSNVKTVGTGACNGCLTAACIVFNSANLTTEGNLNNTKLTHEAGPGSSYLTWQGGGGTNCPAATPTKNATWGSVKSLYR